MAEILPNQPIIFDQEDNCWLEDSGAKLLAEYGDITQFQMGLSPCLGDVDVIEDGNFPDATNWTLGSGWTISGGQACHANGLFGSLSQTAPVSDGVLLRMTFTLDVGSIGCLIQYGAYIENFTQSGTYERWIVADGAAVFGVAANGSAVVCISALNIVTINTNFETYIVDSTGATVSTLTDGDFSDGFFTQDIDWETEALSDDCYTLQVFDPCPCSQGGIIALDFVTGLFNWTIGGNWLITGGTAAYSGSTSSQCELDHVICADVEYTVTYTISNLTGNGEFRVRLGSSLGTLRTADGTYSEQITANSTGFFMTGSSSGGAASFDVTDMSIEIATKTATYESNEIFLQEVLGCNSLALALCNDSDALGFGFLNTGFRPLMRIPASLNRSSYPMDRLAYDYSTGRKTPYYARSRKARELGFDGKEFMHDFAHLFGMADHFYIDDVEMFIEDDEYPSISWDEHNDLGGVTMQVSVKTQLIENKRVSSAVKGCLPNGNPIADDHGELILDEQGRQITDG